MSFACGMELTVRANSSRNPVEVPPSLAPTKELPGMDLVSKWPVMATARPVVPGNLAIMFRIATGPTGVVAVNASRDTWQRSNFSCDWMYPCSLRFAGEAGGRGPKATAFRVYSSALFPLKSAPQAAEANRKILHTVTTMWGGPPGPRPTPASACSIMGKDRVQADPRGPGGPPHNLWRIDSFIKTGSGAFSCRAYISQCKVALAIQ